MAIDFSHRGLTASDQRFIATAQVEELREELAFADLNRDRIYASALASEILAREREVEDV